MSLDVWGSVVEPRATSRELSKPATENSATESG